MIEASADNILQTDFLKALKAGLKESQVIVRSIEKLAKDHGKEKREFESSGVPPADVLEEVRKYVIEHFH